MIINILEIQNLKEIKVINKNEIDFYIKIEFIEEEVINIFIYEENDNLLDCLVIYNEEYNYNIKDINIMIENYINSIINK